MGSIQCIEQAHETDRSSTKLKTRYSTTRTAETVCEIGKEDNQHKQNYSNSRLDESSGARNDIEAACEQVVSFFSSSPSSSSSSSSGGVSEEEEEIENNQSDLKYHSDHQENGQRITAQHQQKLSSYLINFEEFVDIFLDCYLVPKFLVPVKRF